MGCGGSSGTKNTTVPIGNSFVHLIQTGQIDLIRKKLQIEGNQILQQAINFRGDTAAHFACARNCIELVKLLKQYNADFTLKNAQDQSPADLTTNPEILKLIGVKQKLRSATTITTTNDIRTEPNIEENKLEDVRRGENMNNVKEQVKKINENRQALVKNIQMEESLAKVQASEKSRRPRRRQSELTTILKANLEYKASVQSALQ